MTLTQVTIFTFLGLMLYSYVGYPVLLWFIGTFRREAPSIDHSVTSWPKVSIVISAHNEESVVGRRIENLLALDYPRDRLEILIGSDGSTDRTGEIIRRYRTG